MRIDIWSDIVCPFCFIGKRHLELALEGFEHRADVDIVWHSFELDPDMPRGASGSVVEKIATKYGLTREQSKQSQRDVAASAAEVGLTFDWQRAQYGNTFDAHRLVHLAARHDRAAAAQTVLMRAYFSEGIDISDRDALQRLGEEIGLPSEAVRDVLESSAFTDEVRADEAQAREIGASAVPFFVFEGRYAFSGAQPLEVFEQALAQTWAELA